MRAGNDILQSVHLDDDPQLISRCISRMDIQLKLTFKVEPWKYT